MSEEEKTKKYLNTKEACDYLGIKEVNTLYDYIKSGKLKARKLGGNGKSKRHWRISIAALDNFIGVKDAE